MNITFTIEHKAVATLQHITVETLKDHFQTLYNLLNNIQTRYNQHPELEHKNLVMGLLKHTNTHQGRLENKIDQYMIEKIQPGFGNYLNPPSHDDVILAFHQESQQALLEEGYLEINVTINKDNRVMVYIEPLVNRHSERITQEKIISIDTPLYISVEELKFINDYIQRETQLFINDKLITTH